MEKWAVIRKTSGWVEWWIAVDIGLGSGGGSCSGGEWGEGRASIPYVAPATIAILGCLPKGTRSLDLSVEKVNLDLRVKCNWYRLLLGSSFLQRQHFMLGVVVTVASLSRFSILLFSLCNSSAIKVDHASSHVKMERFKWFLAPSYCITSLERNLCYEKGLCDLKICVSREEASAGISKRELG